MNEFRTGKYQVFLPGSKKLIATLEVTDSGILIREAPDFEPKRDPDEAGNYFVSRDKATNFDRVTAVVRHARTQALPAILTDGEPRMFPGDSNIVVIGPLEIRSEINTVLPPNAPVEVTHEVVVLVFESMVLLGTVAIRGHLPLDGSDVRKEVVVTNVGEEVIVPC